MPRIALATLAALVASTSVAVAQQVPCGPSQALVDRLASEYGEAPAVGGVDSAGRLLLVFANTETGTWTAVLANGSGVSCVVSSGEGWSTQPVAAPTPQCRPS